ncbi:hypothetical protein BH09MYX1_BH09MYX1_47970 [soil metagenome]
MLDFRSIPHLLLSWVVLTLALTIGAWLTPGVSIRGGILGHFVASAIFAFVAWGAAYALHVAAAAFGVYAQVSLGFIAHVVVIALLLKLTSMLTTRIEVKSLLRALVAALIVSLASVAIEGALAHVIL